jgi:hypothetical protein
MEGEERSVSMTAFPALPCLKVLYDQAIAADKGEMRRAFEVMKRNLSQRHAAAFACPRANLIFQFGISGS